jgi:hypothetical protein
MDKTFQICLWLLPAIFLLLWPGKETRKAKGITEDAWELIALVAGAAVVLDGVLYCVVMAVHLVIT